MYNTSCIAHMCRFCVNTGLLHNPIEAKSVHSAKKIAQAYMATLNTAGTSKLFFIRCARRAARTNWMNVCTNEIYDVRTACTESFSQIGLVKLGFRRGSNCTANYWCTQHFLIKFRLYTGGLQLSRESKYEKKILVIKIVLIILAFNKLSKNDCANCRKLS